ncbi:MAG: hypothetical protein QGD88_08370, partial [Anaerolineae bacterium]|nr:hypothetical protein [Anaerolineae bacterium]
MRPLVPKKQTRMHSLNRMIFIGLFAGVTITAMIWLRVPFRIITPIFWMSLVGVGLLNALIILRRRSSRRPWVPILAAIVAVTLVYLFPELFGPACGNIPRAFAKANCPNKCLIKVCTKWVPGPSPQCPNPGPGGGCCKKYETRCKKNCGGPPPPPPVLPPTISGSLACDSWGAGGWCIGNESLYLSATEPQGNNVLISGDIDGTPFSCPTGAGTASCSVALPEGAGTANYTATSSTGQSASGSIAYYHDSTPPLINGTYAGTSGSNPWYVSVVELSASASDPTPVSPHSGTSGMATFDYNLNTGGWGSFGGTLSLSDGVHS